MSQNYESFLNYLRTNKVRFEENHAAQLVRFGYNIEVGTIEVVVDFEHEGRIGFFSFLNMIAPNERKSEALALINSFNESLNYGAIILSQSNQLVYKIMLTTFEQPIQDRFWAEVIFRLWSISRDIYPLFGRLLFSNEAAQDLFDEFLKKKEQDQEVDHPHPSIEGASDPHTNSPNHTPSDEGGHPLGPDFRDWYMQN